jgi:hypothetical protein
MIVGWVGVVQQKRRRMMDAKAIEEKLKSLEGRTIEKASYDEKSGSFNFVLDRNEKLTFSVMFRAPYTPGCAFVDMATTIFLSSKHN